MPSNPRIIFDTSGLNALAADKDSASLIPSLSVGFKPRITETCANEITAAPERETRIRLLNVCRDLACVGDCVVPYNEILRRMARAHAEQPWTFNWRNVDVLWPRLSEELLRREFIEDNDLSAKAREDNASLNDSYVNMWREVRPLARDAKSPISLDDVFNEPDREESPHWQLVADLYKLSTGIDLNKASAKAFSDACPPVMAIIYAQCAGQYHWAAKPENAAATYKAGALDLFSGAYLPFCERFITNDKGQYHALRLVAEKAGLATQVSLYSDFVGSMLIAA